MHSHDRTLLARLGFADSDKTNPEHDRACRYLSLPENREALFRVARVPMKGEALEYVGNDDAEEPTAVAWEAETDAVCEFAISKGAGQYKTTIGFADVVLRAQRRALSSDFGANPPVWRATPVIGIEVKVASVSWADALRQINLYRGYLDNLSWILAVRYNVTEEYVAALKREKIAVIRLGPKFQEWMAQDKKVTVSLEEI